MAKFPKNDKAAEDFIPPDPSIALNGAANLLLSMLSEAERDTFMDIAGTTLNIPLWQYVLGIMRQSYSIGLFTTPELDPDWLLNMPAKPIVYNQARCSQCGEVFQPRWPRQEWCSNECGIAYQRNLAATRGRQYIIGGAHPMGEEPPGAITSALRPGSVD